MHVSFNPITTLKGSYYDPFFFHEKTEAQKIDTNLLKIMKLANARIWTQICVTSSFTLIMLPKWLEHKLLNSLQYESSLGKKQER